MRVQRTEAGFTVDAADLGRLLDRPEAEVQRLMRRQKITTRIERGEGEDDGRFRLTFFDAWRRVQLIVDADGRVLRRIRIAAPPRGGDESSAAPGRIP